jgi:hypothetical protein
MILLVDVDSKIPNIALMKLSAYYKKLGNKIDILKLGYSGYPCKKKIYKADFNRYDKVFVSSIFTVNKKVLDIKGNVEYGGTGNNFNCLSEEIDSIEEDYSIYSENNKSYGFITRGCSRNCSFCFVPKKEGLIRFYRHPSQIIKHKQVEFLDNNILAYSGHEDILEWLIDNKIKCNFNQGLDIRLLNEKNASLLSRLKYTDQYIFAFDNIKYKEVINKKIGLFKYYVPADWRVKMFILVGYDSTIQEDIYRIEWCREKKILPYIMRHEKCWSSDYREFYIDLAAYCNQPNIFKKLSPKEYIYKRIKDRQRQMLFINFYK